MTSAAPARFPYATVPHLCVGGTVVCLGGGPSLTPADVDYVRGKASVIAINDAYRLAPWADVLYACDARWWEWHRGVPSFQGLKFSLQKRAAQWPGVRVLRNTGTEGLERKPTGLRTGRNSGYQAINLARHLGAVRVLLLGYDMQHTGGKTHWHGDHPGSPPSYVGSFRSSFKALAQVLHEYQLTIINCSRETALSCFPRQAIDDVL